MGQGSLSFATLNRRVGLRLEQVFWRLCIACGLYGHKRWYRQALAANQELSIFHRHFIDGLPEPRVRILEVGSGPITVLGTGHPFKQIELVATDILAPQYARMLSRHGICPPVKTIWADAENLAATFAPESFEYVTANNCIDHCSDPVRAISQMLTVLKPGHSMALRHREHEGRRHGYWGLHAWSFGGDGGRPVLFNRETRIDLGEVTRLWGPLTVFPEEGHVVFAVKREAQRVPPDAPDCVRRAAAAPPAAE